MSFKHLTIQGIKWSVIGQGVSQAIRFVISVLLARLLEPEHFGQIAMLMVIINFLNTLGRMGVQYLVIQSKNITDDELSTIFWMRIFWGVLFFLAFILAAPLLGRFYHEDNLVQIAHPLSFVLLIVSAGSLSRALLNRRMDFREIIFINNTSLFVSGIVSIIAALCGLGYWSLVIKHLLDNLFRSVLVWKKAKWKPAFRFTLSTFKGKMNDLVSVAGFNVLNFWSRNIDRVVIGRFAGSDILGLYNRAINLTLLPVKRFNANISKVMFPSFSLIQDDILRIRRVFFSLIKLTLYLLAPIMILLVFNAAWLIEMVYGPKWLGMVAYVQITSLLILVQSLVYLNSSVFYAIGKPKLPFKVGLLTKTLSVAACFAGYYIYGVYGLLWGLVIAQLIGLVPEWAFIAKELRFRVNMVLPKFLGLFSCLVVNGFALFFLKQKIHLDEFLYLIVSLLVTLFCFSVSALVPDKKFTLEMWKAYTSKRN